jgi:hypothetical protein
MEKMLSFPSPSPLVKSHFLSFFAVTNVLAQPRGRREARDEKDRQHLSRHREAGERRETGKITIFTPQHPSLEQH